MRIISGKPKTIYGRFVMWTSAIPEKTSPEKIESFIEKTKKQEDVTRTLRDTVKANIFLLLATSKDRAEQEYLHCIIKYFLEHRGVAAYGDAGDVQEMQGAQKLGQFIDFVIMNGQSSHLDVSTMINKHFDTPKSLLWYRIHGMKAIREIDQEIVEASNRIKSYWLRVDIAFNRLLNDVYPPA